GGTMLPGSAGRQAKKGQRGPTERFRAVREALRSIAGYLLVEVTDHPPELRPRPSAAVNARRRPVADVELQIHQRVGRCRHVAVGLDPVAVRGAVRGDPDLGLVD